MIGKEAMIIERQTSSLEVLYGLRHKYIDYIPHEIAKDFDDPIYAKLKCRKNWWNGVVGTFQHMIYDNEMPNSAMEAANEFVKKYCSEEFFQQERVTKENIDEANKVLDMVIRERRSELRHIYTGMITRPERVCLNTL